jgi:hypothetical protein
MNPTGTERDLKRQNPKTLFQIMSWGRLEEIKVWLMIYHDIKKGQQQGARGKEVQSLEECQRTRSL